MQSSSGTRQTACIVHTRSGGCATLGRSGGCEGISRRCCVLDDARIIANYETALSRDGGEVTCRSGTCSSIFVTTCVRPPSTLGSRQCLPLETRQFDYRILVRDTFDAPKTTALCRIGDNLTRTRSHSTKKSFFPSQCRSNLVALFS